MHPLLCRSLTIKKIKLKIKTKKGRNRIFLLKKISKGRNVRFWPFFIKKNRAGSGPGPGFHILNSGRAEFGKFFFKYTRAESGLAKFFLNTPGPGPGFRIWSNAGLYREHTSDNEYIRRNKKSYSFF